MASPTHTDRTALLTHSSNEPVADHFRVLVFMFAQLADRGMVNKW